MENRQMECTQVQTYLKILCILYLLRYLDTFVSVVLQKDPRIVALHHMKDLYQNNIFTQ